MGGVSLTSVAGLFFYPVKSCAGIALSTAAVERRGLRFDRRFLIVDEAGQFLTQRAEPRLALVEVAIDAAPSPGLTLRAPGLVPVRVPLDGLTGAHARLHPKRRVRVWRDEVDAIDCGEASAAWMSDWLGRRASIVYMPDETERAVNPKYARPGDLVGFADGYPLLLVSASSLDDLNARLTQAVTVQRFRPNVVVSGSPAWAEDGWTRISIGEVVLRVAKPCDRCTVTTIDPCTAEKGVEPLRTLATFRARENDVLFGQNCIPDTLGTIAIGDPVVCLAPA